MIDEDFPTATALTRMYRTGQLSPVEATRAALSRIEEHNEAVNAMCGVDAEAAITAAKSSEARWLNGAPQGPVDGVPVTIKDVLAMREWPNRRGSLLTSTERAGFDAPAVARLRESGAVFLGRTATAEFGWKGVTDGPLYGVTRNPWDTTLTPGGSSGGASAALAAGMGSLAIGTDGGGSVRIPASFCGLAALKPTPGRIPAYPGNPFDRVAVHGPMARSVADLALCLDVVGRPDPRDPDSLPAPPGWYVDELTRSGRLQGLRIAYSADFGGIVSVDAEVADAVAAATQVFRDLGAEVVMADPPVRDPIETFHTLWYSGLAKVVDGFPRERRDELDAGLRDLAEQGRRTSAIRYVQALAERFELASAMSRFHQEYDLLITPTVPILPFEAGREAPAASQRWTQWTPFTWPFNLTHQPAVSIPCGLSRSGLPIGLQIVAASAREDLLLRAGYAYEQIAGGFAELVAALPRSAGSAV